jgi:NAD(P)-dependent dehydrogenase (short-subunit alcohol dehydrogenase family)
VIVTGAGSGIGRAVAMRMALEGADVLACDLSAAGLAAVAEEAAAAGAGLRTTVVDVTSPADVGALLDAAGPRVDVLVNNAGIMDHFLPAGEVTDEVWDQVLAVNLTAPMRLCRAVLPGMVDAGRGAIVTVASEASLRAGASGAAYTASKHGVLGLVRSIAFFYGPRGIRSNAVLPGPVATGIGASSAPHAAWAMERAMAALAAMPPTANPDEIATAVSWLASDEASNINGAVLAADGGWSAA